ncbi:MAG TPA: universal stress protein [Burkholderiales bacterium]|nr:universal stress protein [Burkholderiales bacterium]HXJ09007.1 universal stress protein [Burkholderiales bacterium]
MNIVVPIEEGRDSSGAVGEAIAFYRRATQPVQIHLLNVRTPLPSYVARFIAASEREAFHHENGLSAMRPAIAQLDAAGISHLEHVQVGNKAETILRFAREHDCSHIVVGKPAGLLGGLGLGSIGAQLRRLVQPGDHCQILEGGA